MPEISRFLGIVIYMYFNEHNPPHFHDKYENFRAVININELKISDGSLPPRVLSLVTKWASIHKQELIDNWNNIIATGKFNKIQPLT